MEMKIRDLSQCKSRNRDSHYKDKTVIGPSYLYNVNPYTDKTAFYIETVLWGVKCLSQILHIDGLVQERPNTSALALELCLSGTNPTITEVHCVYLCI